MKIDTFLQQLEQAPDSISFNDTIAVIEAHYHFTPIAFRNGELKNMAGENSGSCKIFSFARLLQLSPTQTLQCFGSYYREDVLKNPNANDHQNIRQFIRSGWPGIHFEGHALSLAGG